MLSYQLSLDIDACAEKMTIQLEKMFYTVSLFDYQMGTKGTAKLFGVLVIEYVLNKQYIISISFEFSMEIFYWGFEYLINFGT